MFVQNLYMNVHSSIIRNNQKVEINKMFINWWLSKWDVTYLYIWPLKNRGLNFWSPLTPGFFFSNKCNQPFLFVDFTSSDMEGWLYSMPFYINDLSSHGFGLILEIPTDSEDHSTTEYYSALKRNEILSNARTWMNQVKEARHKVHILYDSIYMKCSE